MEGITSRHSFAVMSTGRRPAKTTEPKVSIATTKGKIKLNEAATRLLQLQHGDHAAFVNDSADLAEGEVVTWGIIKGYPVLDAKGQPKQSVKRLTNEEAEALVEAGEVDDDGKALTQYEPKMMGFKLASPGKGTGVGLVLDGSDAVNYQELGGNEEKNIVYDLNPEPVTVEIDGNEVLIYILGEKEEVEKIQRG